jgi:hypothetical protein
LKLLTSPPPSERTSPPIDPFAAFIVEASKRFAVPEHWIRAVMHVESAGKSQARSQKGATGWINEGKETTDLHGRPLRLDLILPDRFYTGVLDEALGAPSTGWSGARVRARALPETGVPHHIGTGALERRFAPDGSGGCEEWREANNRCVSQLAFHIAARHGRIWR